VSNESGVGGVNDENLNQAKLFTLFGV